MTALVSAACGSSSCEIKKTTSKKFKGRWGGGGEKREKGMKPGKNWGLKIFQKKKSKREE